MPDIVKELRDAAEYRHHPPRPEIVSKELEWRAADEIDSLTQALMACESWIDRWTKHVGNCEGGAKCTCGRTAILYEAGAALAKSFADQP